MFRLIRRCSDIFFDSSTSIYFLVTGTMQYNLTYILIQSTDGCGMYVECMWNSTIVAIRITNDNKIGGIETIDRKDHQVECIVHSVLCFTFYVLPVSGISVSVVNSKLST